MPISRSLSSVLAPKAAPATMPDMEREYKAARIKEIEVKEKAMGDMFPGEYDPEGGIKDLEDALMGIAPMFGVEIQPFAASGKVSPEAASFIVTINEALEQAGSEELGLEDLGSDTALQILASEIDDAAGDRRLGRWLEAEAKPAKAAAKPKALAPNRMME